MNLDDTIAEVLRLDEAATKGPWKSDSGGRVTGHGTVAAYSAAYDWGTMPIDVGNVALIARYRTLAPELARAPQRMRLMLRAAAQWHAEESARTHDADVDAATAWNGDASSLGIGTEAPERDELWPVYREAFEAELKRARGEGG